MKSIFLMMLCVLLCSVDHATLEHKLVKILDSKTSRRGEILDKGKIIYVSNKSKIQIIERVINVVLDDIDGFLVFASGYKDHADSVFNRISAKDCIVTRAEFKINDEIVSCIVITKSVALDKSIAASLQSD